MRTRRLGSSVLEVTVVGLGCNNFGGRIDEAESRAVIDAAIDAGVTFFDTADVYGNRGGSEEIIGRALDGRRDEVVLATKFGHDLGDGETARGARPYIRKAIEASLRRLQTDRIDLYQYHRPDGVTPLADTLEALHELVQEGTVRAIGSSNFTPAMVEEAAAIAAERGLTPFASEQSQYSWLRRGAEEELLPASERLGVGFIPYFPLASGLLTGKYAKGEPPPEGTRLYGPRARRGRPGRSRAAARVRGAERRLAARCRDRRARSRTRRRLGDRGRDEAGAGARERSRRLVGAERGAARRAARALTVLAEVAAAAALVCLDPGHGTAPEVGRQLEPIGPGSAQLKIKDAGGAAGEAPVALSIARRTRTLLRASRYRVAMTRDGTGYRGGNRERAALLQRARRRADDPHPRRRVGRSRRPGNLDTRSGAAAAAGRATSTARAAARAHSSNENWSPPPAHATSVSSSAPT